MKAEGIEQIREHLARGGRVTLGGYEVESTYDKYLIAKQANGVQFQVEFNPGRWELLPIETEGPTGEWFRNSQKERMQRIRQSLLFGHYPAMNDLIDWWQATTGERIEWGRRCNYCDGNGNVPSEYYEGPCEACKDHPGYTVRPTWMGEVNANKH